MNFQKKIFIGNGKFLSESDPVFIIAEIGINHEGNLEKCFSLINKAKMAGADAVKIQLANPDTNYKKGSSSYKIFKQAQFSFTEINRIYDFAKKNKIILFATLDEFYLDKFKKSQTIFKISSSQFNDLKIIKKICKLNKPTLISTGMSNVDEIKKLTKFVSKLRNNKIVFMHCVSKYPLNDYESNLEVINYMKKNISKIVGYSDHTLGINVSQIAVCLGAKVIEKHFTLNSKKKGFDHKISLDFKSFKNLVHSIRYLEKVIGSLKKNESIKSQDEITQLKRSYFLSKNLKKGQILSLNDVYTKRIGKNTSVRKLLQLLGKKSIKQLKKNSEIVKKDFK